MVLLDDQPSKYRSNYEAKGAYPIATLTWILAYETGNGKKTEAVKELYQVTL